MRQWACSLGILLSAVATSAAMGGVVMSMETTGGPRDHTTNTMSIEPDRLKMTTDNGGAVIYRADEKKVMILDGDRHSYIEMTPESMQQMRGQMDQAMQRMQAQMQAMPPEQRKQMEAMMAQRGLTMPPMGGPAAPRKVSYEKLGASRTVGKWSCTPYKMVVDGKSLDELCVARLSDVGLSRDDLKSFISLGAFMEQMFSAPGAAQNRPAAAFDFEGMTKAIGYDGIPVQTIHYGPDGKSESQTTFKSVDHKTIPGDTFDVPAGFQKREMPTGRPGH